MRYIIIRMWRKIFIFIIVWRNRKKIKNTRTKINFSKFLSKFNFFYTSYFLSTFDGSRINGINPGIIIWCYFFFFFIKELLETFILDIGTGFWVGVCLGFHYADIEVTDFLWFERKSSSSNKVAPLNVCILDQLHPCTYRMQNT